jgi:hypothetical protein
MEHDRQVVVEPAQVAHGGTHATHTELIDV